MCVLLMCMSGVDRGLERVLDLLELELQPIVSCLVVKSLWKSNSALKH